MPAWWEAAAAAVASAAVKEEAAAAAVKKEAAAAAVASASVKEEERARFPCSAAPACTAYSVIDVDDFSETEADPPAASAAVLEAVDAAKTLLSVNTNANGGSVRFHACTAALRDLMADAPGDGAGKARALAVLDAMAANYIGKCPGSWKPFVVCAVRAFGGGDEAVARLQRSSRSKSEHLDTAERITDERSAAGASRRQIAAGPHMAAGGGTAEECFGRRSLPGRLAQTPSPTNPRLNVAAAAVTEAGVGPSPAALPTAILPTQAVSPPSAPKGRRAVSKGPARTSSASAPARTSSAASAPGADSVQRGLDQFFARVQPPQGAAPEAVGGGAVGAEIPGAGNASAPPKRPHRAAAESARDEGALSGHRAVLRLPASGGGSLRSAYLRRALEAHPDKGGSAAEFQAVLAAFEALSAAEADERSSDVKVEEETQGEGGTDAAAAAAKSVCSMLRQAPASAWERLLSALDPAALEALEALLAGHRDAREAACRSRAARGRESAVALREETAGGPSFAAGITKSGQGYSVTVSWRSFRAKSGVIRTLEQAINLHVLLVRSRNAALLRHEAFLRDLNVLRVEERGGAIDECAVVLESELSKVSLEEPLVQLYYASDHISRKTPKNGQSKRIMSPFTPSLASTLRFRQLILGVQGTEEGGPVQQRLDSVTVRVAELKKLMQAQAVLDRASATALDRDFGEAVAREVRRRGTSSSSARAVPQAPAGSQIVPVGSSGRDGSSTQLALAEAAFEPVAELAAAHRDVVAMLSADATRRDEANRAEIEGLRTDLRCSIDERRRADKLQAFLSQAQERELEAQRDLGEARRQAVEEMQRRVAKDEDIRLLEEQLQKEQAKARSATEARNQLLRSGAGSKRPLAPSNSDADIFAGGPAQRPRYDGGIVATRRMYSGLG